MADPSDPFERFTGWSGTPAPRDGVDSFGWLVRPAIIVATVVLVVAALAG